MLTFLKIVVSFVAISAVGYQLAHWADSFFRPDAPQRIESPFADAASSRSPTADTPIVTAKADLDPVMESLVTSFLDSNAAIGGFALEKKLTALDLNELEDFYIEALSFDLIDRRAFEAAGLALEAIAAQDPGLAVQLLYSLSPAEKERLAAALSSGWTQYDALSAWDWIDSAWIDQDGEFIDRRLQNLMFREALGVVLEDRSDFQLAADLVSSLAEPELRIELADRIAFKIVSENPVQALNRLDFESDALLDSSIMNAIMDEWSQRDSIGAMAWTLENLSQVSNQATRSIAKDLLLNGVYEQLASFHYNLVDAGKRDSVAWESARLLARRDPQASIAWISVIETLSSRYNAFNDSLYEIGHDDFESSVQFAELAYSAADLNRETVLFETLQSWTAIDTRKVREYLDSSDALSSSQSLIELREAIN